MEHGLDQTALTWTDIPRTDITFTQRAQSRGENRAYVIGTMKKGWCAAVEAHGRLTKIAENLASEAAAKQHAEDWERARES